MLAAPTSFDRHPAPRRGARDQPISVMARNGRKPRIEIGAGIGRLRHRNGQRPQMKIHRIAQFIGAHFLFKVKMGDLPRA